MSAKVVPDSGEAGLGIVEDKYAHVDLLGKKKKSTPASSSASPKRSLTSTLAGSFKRKTKLEKMRDAHEKMMNKIVEHKESSPQLVSAILRRQSRARSVSADNLVMSHDYFEDDDIMYDYDQTAMNKLVDRHRKSGAIPRRWRKTHLVTLLVHDGDHHKIPPTILKLIKTGHALDGTGLFPELLDIMKRSKCVVLSFGKSWTVDFYPISAEDARDIYGQVPSDVSFEDVCRERGETYTERLNSIVGIDVCLADGLLCGARRRAVLETFSLEEIGIPKSQHLVIQANWGGPQTVTTNEDAYVVTNRSRGPYVLTKVDGGHPIGYRRFFDVKLLELNALIEKAKKSTKLVAKRWRRSGLACLLLYNGDTSLIPDTVFKVMIESIVHFGEHEEYRGAGLTVARSEDILGFKHFAAVILDFGENGKPMFVPVTSDRIAETFENFRFGEYDFEAVVRSRGEKFRDLLFKFEGMRNVARRGLLIGADERNCITTFRGSELGMRHGAEVVLETYLGCPHIVPKDEDVFVVCNDYDGEPLLLNSEKVDGSIRPVGYVVADENASTHRAQSTKFEDREVRIADTIPASALTFDRVQSMSLPNQEHRSMYMLVTMITIILGLVEVCLQGYLLARYVAETHDVWVPVLTGVWLVLPMILKSQYSCMLSRCIDPLDKVSLLPQGMNAKGAFEIFGQISTVDHGKSMVALATSEALDVIARSFPQVIMQTYLLTSDREDDVKSVLILAVIAASCVAAGAKVAAINMAFDCSRHHRRADSSVFGYYPSGTIRQTLMYVTEALFSTTYFAMRSLVISCALAAFGAIPVIVTLLFDLAISVVVRFETGHLPYYTRRGTVNSALLSILIVYTSFEFAPVSIARSPYLMGGAVALCANAYAYGQSIVAGALVYFLDDDTDCGIALSASAIAGLFSIVAMASIVLLADPSFDLVAAWVRHRTPHSHFEKEVWSTVSPNPFGTTIDDYRGWILEVWRPSCWHYKETSRWIGRWMHAWTKREHIIPPWASETWMNRIPDEFKREGEYLVAAELREKETLDTQKSLRMLRLSCETSSGDKMLKVLQLGKKWKRKACGPKMPPGMLLAMSAKKPKYDPLAALKANFESIEASKEPSFVMEELSDGASIASEGEHSASDRKGEGDEGDSDSDASIEL